MNQEKAAGAVPRYFSRRRFLGITGGLAGLGLLAAATGCKDNDGNEGLDLGSGDTGLLNLLYALEQLAAAFYTALLETPYEGITEDERTLLTDIRDHELCHRELYRSLLGGNAIADLEFNFKPIIFEQKASVLAAAKTIEDLSTSACNGIGSIFASTDTLLLTAKIAAVEARHAAWIRSLLGATDFAGSDVVGSGGFGRSRTPNEVIALASGYIRTKLNGNNLPKS